MCARIHWKSFLCVKGSVAGLMKTQLSANFAKHPPPPKKIMSTHKPIHTPCNQTIVVLWCSPPQDTERRCCEARDRRYDELERRYNEARAQLDETKAVLSKS